MITTFFEGFNVRDSMKTKSVCSGEIILQAIAEVPKGNT
jgi:hypothetical protein